MMATMNGLTSDLDSLERLMRWIAPRTLDGQLRWSDSKT